MRNKRKTAQTWKYRVVKSQRGLDGKWFTCPAAATFKTELEAREYAEQFAVRQRAAGVVGAMISVLSRRRLIGNFGPTNSVAEYRI